MIFISLVCCVNDFCSMREHEPPNESRCGGTERAVPGTMTSLEHPSSEDPQWKDDPKRCAESGHPKNSRGAGATAGGIAVIERVFRARSVLSTVGTEGLQRASCYPPRVEPEPFSRGLRTELNLHRFLCTPSVNTPSSSMSWGPDRGSVRDREPPSHLQSTLCVREPSLSGTVLG